MRDDTDDEEPLGSRYPEHLVFLHVPTVVFQMSNQVKPAEGGGNLVNHRDFSRIEDIKPAHGPKQGRYVV